MKTSPELLTDMLGVLGQISTKLDSINSKKDKNTGSGVGVGVVLGALIKGKKSVDNINLMADSIKKLSAELNKVNIKKLNNLIDAIATYRKIPAEDPKKARIGGLAHSAKDMGLALLYTAGGIAALAGTFYVASKYLGMKPFEILGFLVLTSAALALSMLIIAGADMAGTKMGSKVGLGGMAGLPAGKGRGKEATQSAKDMGLALMMIAGGILAFSVVLMLVPKALNVTTPIIGLAVIAGVIVAISGIFWLMGKLKSDIGMGALVGVAVAIGMAALAWGIKKFVDVAKGISDMGKGGEVVNKNVKTRGKFGQMFAEVGPGLGMMGIILLSSIALFAILGGVALTGIGAVVIFSGIGIVLATSAALIGIAKSIKEVSSTIDKIGGPEKLKDVAKSIELMVGGVTNAVIKGVMGSVDNDGGKADGNLSIREMTRFRRVKRIIRMVGNISSSLTKFAEGLKAFATLGEISSLEYKEVTVKDIDGNTTTELKPVIGGTKIHVTVIAKSIADTFGLFIKTMVNNTTKMHLGQGAALKRLAKALTGDRGLISGVSQFASTLKTFSTFGAKQEIWVPKQYKNENIENEKERNAPGNIVDGTGVSVPIQVISDSIVSTFGTFVDKMAASASKFTIGGAIGMKMAIFTEALIGKQRSVIGKLFAREKPGILSGITAFSEVLTTYAQYGKKGLVPIKDPKTGDIIDTMTMDEVAASMVNSISSFVSGFEKAAGAAGLEKKATSVQDKITSITNIVTQFDVLAQTGEGVEKLANSLGLLATNIGLLVTNTAALDTAKLQSLSTITAQHAVTTKGVAIAPQSSTSVASSTSTGGQADWDKIADRMGQIIAQKLTGGRGGEFEFHFFDGNSGGKLEIKEK